MMDGLGSFELADAGEGYMRVFVLVAVVSGLACQQGPKGEAGPQGPVGPTGATGPQAQKGDPGQVVVLVANDGGFIVVDGGVAIVAGPPGSAGVEGPIGTTGPAGATGSQGPATPTTLTNLVNTNGVIGSFVSYYYDDTANVRLVIAVENWAGVPLLLARNETSGAVTYLPWQRLVIQYPAPNCTGAPYIYANELARTWPLFSGSGWYITQNSPQNLALYSQKYFGGGCLNFTTISTYAVLPIVSIPTPPIYSGPLWMELK